MMNVHKIQDRGIAQLFLFLHEGKKEEFIESVLNEMPYDDAIGFAGFANKDFLRHHLEWTTGDLAEHVHLDEPVIAATVEGAVRMCFSCVKSGALHIFVFPTSDNFVKGKMGGVSGYSFWKNTILLYINPVEGWQKALKESVCHEFAHAFALNFNPRKTILDSLIFEGIAEHFREFVAGGGKAPWAASLTREEALKIFDEIRNYLDAEDGSLYRDIFYGTGKYPLWAGYALGYYIVGDCIGKMPKDWNLILRSSPKEMFEKSGHFRGSPKESSKAGRESDRKSVGKESGN